jgi:hypothetical protein
LWAFLLAFMPAPLSIPAGIADGGETPVYAFMVFPILPIGRLKADPPMAAVADGLFSDAPHVLGAPE